MNNINTINQILESFSKSISINDVKLNDDNTCILRLDDSQDIQIIYDPLCNTLNFLTQVGDLPEQGKDQTRCCDYLLKSNSDWSLTQGATLSKKVDQTSIVLGYRLPLFQLTLSTFEKILELFIERMDTWKSYIQQIGQGNLPEALAEL